MKKKIILLSTIAAAVFLSCNNPQTNESNDTGEMYSKETAEEHNDAKFDNKTEDDAQFVVNAAYNHLTTISLCDLAIMRATHNDVRELANSIHAQHSKANRELEEIASQKGITMPTLQDKENMEYKNLESKTGTEFDKAFYDKIVGLQKDAIDMYQEANTDLADSQLRDYASHQLPTIRVQLDRSMDNQKVAENWE